MNGQQPYTLFAFRHFALAAIVYLALYSGSFAHAEDPLPSCNDGPAKKAILKFVAAVTDENGKDYSILDSSAGACFMRYAMFIWTHRFALRTSLPRWASVFLH